MTAALAEQHRRDLIARAESYRLARTARTSRSAPARHAPRFPVITQLSAMVARATARVFPGHGRRATTGGPGHGVPTAS